MADLRLSGGGTVYLLTPQTTAGEEWCKMHLYSPNEDDLEPLRLGRSIIVEHRYIEAIVVNAIADGLEIQ